MKRKTTLLFTITAVLLGLTIAADATPRRPDAPKTAAKGTPVFLAVGYGGLRMTSRDGKTWENITEWAKDGGDDENLLFSSVFVDGTAFVVGGGATTGHVLVTEDGKNWREVHTEKTRIIPILYAKKRFLAGCADHLITSADGEHWTDAAKTGLEGSVHFRRGVFGNGVFVFAGDVDSPPNWSRNDFRFSTADGTTVVGLERGLPPTRGLAFGAGRFVLVGKDGFRQVSTDGKTWTKMDEPDEDFQWIQYVNGEFLLGGKSLWSSKNGLTWTKRENVPAYPGVSAFGSGVYVGTSWKGNAHYSAAPLTGWTKAPWGETNAIESITYGVLKK